MATFKAPQGASICRFCWSVGWSVGWSASIGRFCWSVGWSVGWPVEKIVEIFLRPQIWLKIASLIFSKAYCAPALVESVKMKTFMHPLSR